MDTNYRNISHFFIAGINYKKTDVEARGNFAISDQQYASILEKARSVSLNELFILSTCNRTEIYGFASSVSQLIDLLCAETAGSKDEFLSSCYTYSGSDAVSHLFNVGAGLDSQILGDYEIIGQLKTAVKTAKASGFIGAFMERLVNEVLRASKQIKNQTSLSGGTVSVSFAAVQFLANSIPNAAKKKILLLGTGKIGSNTCRNLFDYLGARNITLINRTEEKAQQLAGEMNLRVAPWHDLETEIAEAEVILAAAGADDPLIKASALTDCRPRLIIDLSMPAATEASVRELPGVNVVNVDELSKLRDETLRKRETEVPKAKAIIAGITAEFLDWYEMRRHVPLLKNLKQKLQQIHTHPHIAESLVPEESRVQIQRVLNETAGKIRANNQRGCQYIAAINQFISA